ncbi:hypothetical protein [Streptomyces stelliscabiei]|uniref:hypothetical protein n=1 Tax=Streptomyces stelliscabiei TaxID=146820 RepID=UPI0029B324B7|nr:hypothetical protein [Streptomyces stelliscabiei]MDX2550205.1 hypothetical protein [Streptomyces stelliscabiei]MDX2610496.1 hypothetical protein [Streptomyces stelliscabiei]MDX2635415.1 hypothetical protein [Streptomyces stelliscabiei]MDX2665688.1 hypothetical protein [Streptomyces stelliscabiei]MDX2710555.1 hypothetical protein [Streptomyces stelliscabiei]
MSDEIARALTAVLEPAPGRTVPIPDVHRAVLAHIGVTGGVTYRAVKGVLRAVGVVVTGQSGSYESFAHGVSLTSELRNPRRSANN